MQTKFRGSLLLLALAGAIALIAAPFASAHVTVRPAEAAPDDPVLWTVMVPNEEENAHTTSVEVQVPDGVTPFSYADIPGWKREVAAGPDGSVKSVKWTGSLSTDGLGRFSFLASAPAEEGEIEWKAIQTYSNGETVRWIGPPDADHPASVTTVSGSVPPQAGSHSHGDHGEVADSAEGASAEHASGEDGDGSTTATVISIVALVAALGALGLAFVARRRS